MRLTIANCAFWTNLGRAYPRFADMGERMFEIHLTVWRSDGSADLYVTES